MRKPCSGASLAACVALLAAATSLVLPGCARVTCDRFTLHGTLIGNTLAVSVTTDLPDGTEVDVRVSRRVYVKGDTLPYAIHYFAEKGHIADWRLPRTIVLDHGRWRADLREKQQAGGPSGTPLHVTRIEPTVELEALVPVDQSDKRFGDGNWNLRGKAVDVEGNWRVVRRKLKFPCPLPDQTP
jgi:hypothetical protein